MMRTRWQTNWKGKNNRFGETRANRCMLISWWALLVMLSAVTSIADCDKPLDRFSANLGWRISFVMNLICSRATIHAASSVSL